MFYFAFTFYLHANNHQTTTADTMDTRPMQTLSDYMSYESFCHLTELKYGVRYGAGVRLCEQALRESLEYIVGRSYKGICTHVRTVRGMAGGTYVSFVQKEERIHPRIDMFRCMSLVLNALPTGFKVNWGQVWEEGSSGNWTCESFECRVPMRWSCGEYTSHHAEGTMTSAVADWETWGKDGWIADERAFVPCDDEREEELRAAWRKFRDAQVEEGEPLGDVLVFEMNDEGAEGVGHWEAPPRRHNFRRDIKSRRKGFSYVGLTRKD